MNYTPEVNDYVQWIKGVEGWVYFKDKEYITIEVAVKPKNAENYEACSIHRNDRLLVLCFADQWNELIYVRSRDSRYEEEKDIVEILGKSIRREGIEK